MKIRRRNKALVWLEESYALPTYVRPARLINQHQDGSYRCCGGYAEHFSECPELCCFCGQPFDDLPPTSWNRKRHNGPNGFPAHAGCMEDEGYERARERHPDDGAVFLEDET